MADADAEMQEQEPQETLNVEPSRGRSAEVLQEGQRSSWAPQLLQSCEQALADTGGPVQYLEAVLQHDNEQEFPTSL